MYQPLIPCPSCERHIRTTEAACPFCACALPNDAASRVVPGTNQRLGRAAAFVFGAAIAATGCAGAVAPDASNDAATTSDANSSADTGGATDVAPTDAATPVDDCGAPATLYGLPPPPCGAVDSGPPDDNGGGSADYGSPPPMDGG